MHVEVHSPRWFLKVLYGIYIIITSLRRLMNRSWAGIAAAVIGMLSANDAVAGFVDGFDLLAICRPAEVDPVYRLKVAECHGYVIGAADSFDCSRPSSGFAWDSTAPGTQKDLVDSVVKWLRAHPDTLHYQANSLVAAALSEAHPCTPGDTTSSLSPATP